MGKGYKHGASGGASLNFNVKIYPSETELKADKPRDNTIGVITTTTMTSWVFSATEPAEPEVGMVWIIVGKASSSEFNALKKNALQVYPISAKQYVGDKFTKVTAFTYKNEKWNNWRTYLYNKGDQCEDITGGWKAVKGSGGTATFNEDNIKTSYSGSSGRQVSIYTNNKIDISNVSKVSLVVQVTDAPGGSSSKVTIGISETNTDYNFVNVASASVDSVGNHVVTVDVSTYSGEYYVGYKTMYATAVTTEIYME